MSNVALTGEQFEQLLKHVRDNHVAPHGLGAPGSRPFRPGLGSSGGPSGPGTASPYDFLELGSPRLALAKALGVRIVPYVLNVRATFPDTDTTVIPDVGSDVKIVQDTLIDAMVARVTNKSTTVNQNQYQSLSDFFFGFQSGIEVIMNIQGAPRPSVIPKYTPLSNAMDMVNGNGHWPWGWVLTYQQQINMSFQATITLPYAPIEVVCTFRAWTPDNDMNVDLSNRDAFAALAKLGYVCDPDWQAAYLSTCR